MASRVMSWRSIVGVATLTTALGLTVVAPATASAAPAGARSVAASSPSAVAAAAALPVLRRGSTGPRVRYVQRVLGVKATGFYGLRTTAAVKRFQKSTRIAPANGVVGPATWTALRRKAAAASRARLAAPAPAPIASTGDPTMSAAARSSRAARVAIPLAVWITSAHGRAIVKRESGGSCTIKSPGGAYRGKWQMGSSFWRGYGGLAFAATPDLATCAEQDQVAYRGWLASWWGPWGG